MIAFVTNRFPVNALSPVIFKLALPFMLPFTKALLLIFTCLFNTVVPVTIIFPSVIKFPFNDKSDSPVILPFIKRFAFNEASPPINSLRLIEASTKPVIFLLTVSPALREASPLT